VADDLVSVILAAGAGTRLLPLTTLIPKALCPVNNVPLVDLALGRARSVATEFAVNVHHSRDLMAAHLAGRAHLSVEEPEPLGTAGALGNLRGWIGGRDVLVLNADSWQASQLRSFVEDWDRERIRLLCTEDPTSGDFGELRYSGAALMPWRDVAALEAIPSGLYEVSWRTAEAQGRLDLVETDARSSTAGPSPTTTRPTWRHPAVAT
jgi:MurNAc alpha-1-phosphate uridylyltransferase